MVLITPAKIIGSEIVETFTLVCRTLDAVSSHEHNQAKYRSVCEISYCYTATRPSVILQHGSDAIRRFNKLFAAEKYSRIDRVVCKNSRNIKLQMIFLFFLFVRITTQKQLISINP